MSLAHEIVVAYPDDTDRDTGLISRVVTGSSRAEHLRSLTVRKASFDLRNLAAGPGASRLGGLTLSESLHTDADWRDLEEWTGWETLQAFQLTNTISSVVLDDALWDLLDDAEALHTLDLSGTHNADVTKKLLEHPELSERLTELILNHCNLSARSIDDLAANTKLKNLIRLELRQNRLGEDVRERLAELPVFENTTIVVGP